MFKAKNEGQRANSLIRNRKTGHLRKVSLPPPISIALRLYPFVSATLYL